MAGFCCSIVFVVNNATPAAGNVQPGSAITELLRMPANMPACRVNQRPFAFLEDLML